MQEATFVAITDLEIGDKVGVSFDSDLTYEVYDIRTMYTVRDGKVKLEFLLSIDGGTFPVWMDREDIIYPLISAGVEK